MKQQFSNAVFAVALGAFVIVGTSMSPARAQAPSPPPAEAPAIAAPLATKTVWASGLKAPQGIARDRNGNVYIAEYAGGQLAKFSAEGKPLGKIGVDLKSPAWIERVGDTLYVSERKANRLLRLERNGQLTPIASPIVEPLGLVALPQKSGTGLLAIAHTTSVIWRLDDKHRLNTVYSAPSESGKRYGYRCLAVDRDGSVYITDEVEGQILLLTPAGKVATWAKGLDDPTAVVIGPDGHVYVAEEGPGRISRLNAHGEATVVAEGLGQARDIEFLNSRTMLVSDRKNGVVWQVALPEAAATPAKSAALPTANGVAVVR